MEKKYLGKDKEPLKPLTIFFNGKKYYLVDDKAFHVTKYVEKLNQFLEDFKSLTKILWQSNFQLKWFYIVTWYISYKIYLKTWLFLDWLLICWRWLFVCNIDIIYRDFNSYCFYRILVYFQNRCITYDLRKR